MTERVDITAAKQKSLRLIVVDDKPAWCQTIGFMVQGLGHTLDVANTLEEAKIKIRAAEEQGNPYTIAIIDMNFEIEGVEVSRGQEAIKYIKDHHNYMACIVASGQKVMPDDVLDLRDEYGLDYYLQKDRIDMGKIKKALQTALKRIELAGAANKHQQDLPETPNVVRAISNTQPSPAGAISNTGAASMPQPATPGVAASPANIQVALDFHLHGSSAQITWRSSLIGRRVTPFAPPYTAEQLPLVIRALDALQYPNYPTPATGTEERHFTFSAQEQQTLDQIGLWQHTRLAPTAHRSVGQALYAALGADGQDALAALRNASIAQRQTTSYVLRFPPDGIDLAVLPWELLWDRQKNQAVLIRGNTIDSCERYVDIDMAIPPPLAADQRPHLLALTPHYQIPDAIRQEERAARLATWEQLAADGRISYAEISPLTMRALNDELRKTPTRPDVVHYFGHGIYRDGTGYLVFDDGRGGRDLVSAERLATVLGDVRLVVIHACQSAMIDDAGGLLTGVAPALSIVTGAVVAMQLTVRIEAATRFAEVFYEELLGKGCSLQEAVARGRQVLFTETPDGASWYVPTLYIRSREPQPVYLLR
jgi:CheY-like chemotaxis protein